MRGSRVKALRAGGVSHPGRKHGGRERAVATGRSEDLGTNKFLGSRHFVKERSDHLLDQLLRLFRGQR